VKIEYLVKMANDIGAFFESESGPDGVSASVANHMKRFWDPRMRKQILAHQVTGGAGLTDHVRQAVALLAEDGQK
jgi:formate dehydrogenase subunit delta